MNTAHHYYCAHVTFGKLFPTRLVTPAPHGVVSQSQNWTHLFLLSSVTLKKIFFNYYWKKYNIFGNTFLSKVVKRKLKID